MSLPTSAGALPHAARRAAQRRDAAIGLAFALPWWLAGGVLLQRGAGHLPAVVAGGMALLVLALLVLALWRWHRWRQFNDTWLVRALNATRSDMEDSADLLLPQPPLTALQQLQQQRLLQRLRNTPPVLRAAWPHRRVLLSLLACTSLTAAVLLLPGKPHPPLSQAAHPQPVPPAAPARLQNARVRVLPPPYTGLPQRLEHALSLKAVTGSRLQWQLQFSGTPAHVALLFLDGHSLPLQASKDGWTASQPLAASGLYRVQVDGRWLENGKLHRLDALPDLPPQVRVLQPEQSLQLARPGQTVWELVFEASDDYGVQPNANLHLTLAQGSGENIQFHTQTLRVPGQAMGTGKRRSFRHRLALTTLGMHEGDDVIAQLEVADNRNPQPQHGRSPSLILRMALPQDTQSTAVESVVRRVMPAYFRSQRQIIIDAEALQKQRRALAAEVFLKQADAIGVDQRILRLRYGQFLGEEAEGGPKATHGTAPTADTDSAAPTAAGAHPDDSHADDAHTTSATPGNSATFGQIDHLLETFGHTHDIAEAATLLDPQTRAILKQALDQMWQSELQLRQGQPDRALPFAYKALGLIKQVQQSERIYLAKVAPQQQPLDLTRRLSGKREGIAPRPDALQPASPQDAPLATLWQALNAGAPAASLAPALASFTAWQRQHPTRVQDPLALQAALENLNHAPDCTGCRAALQRQLWPLLAVPAASATRRRAADAQGQRYLDALRAPAVRP